ncbi:MAG: sulfatase-like hydrolase/transferase, partial [Planctomycetales bacterium]|nr:sulfatase-like hydrolase/transferase [Planctomycetales bacterium]
IIEQLQVDRDQPLFLACGIFRPHMPWFAPQSFFDQYPASALTMPKLREDDLQDIPSAGRKMAIGNKRAGVKAIANSEFGTIRGKGLWSNAVQAYLASMSYADQQVGRLLDALDESGQADKTIIILLCDHGWHLGEKHHWKKFTLWEEATRVPLIIVAPGVTKANQQTDQPVSLLDIYPTLVDLCQLPEPDQLDGKNLRPLLDGSAIRWDHAAVTTHGKDNHAVRSQHWRYIRYQDGSEELYDHRVDSQEWTNLADDVRFAQVKTELAAWLPQSNAEPTARIDAKRESSDDSNELGQFDWGSAEVTDSRLVLKVDQVNAKQEITIPRLNNSLVRIRLNGNESTDVRLQPEPTEWRIAIPPDIKLPCTVELEFGQAVYLPTSPRTITPGQNGQLILHARDAVTHGKLLRFEPQPHKNTVGYWANQDDWAEWHFQVAQPGTYQVTLRQGCGTGHGGSEVRLQIGQQKLTFQVEETGGFQNWKDRLLGTVTLNAAESATLQLRPQNKPGGAVMDVQQITLMPVADTDKEE